MLPNQQSTRRGLVAYVGQPTQVQTLSPMLEALQHAAPNVEPVLLLPAGSTGIAAQLVYSQPYTAQHTEALIAELATFGCAWALICTEAEYSPYALAYASYLAGISRRIAYSCEFGGDVLSEVVPPPRQTLPEQRHLRLLAASGLFEVAHA